MPKASGYVLAVLMLSACGATRADGSVTAGKSLYQVCAGCHGFEAQGNAEVGAPSLLAAEPWYLRRQLDDFKRGLRGNAPTDVHGQQMAPMALALGTDRDIDDVLAYLATLPPTRPRPTLETADAEKGRQAYAVCAACHGRSGEGSEQLSAPRLAGLEDWYVAGQLALYKSGLRGANAQDTYGTQMRAIVAALPDAQIDDIAAYVATLGASKPQ